MDVLLPSSTRGARGRASFIGYIGKSSSVARGLKSLVASEVDFAAAAGITCDISYRLLRTPRDFAAIPISTYGRGVDRDGIFFPRLTNNVLVKN